MIQIGNQLHFRNMSGEGVHEKILEMAKPFLIDRYILVAGSGEGELEYRLLETGLKKENIWSIDFNPQLFKLREISCKFCDLNKEIPFRDNYFDIIFAIEVIEHLFNPHNLIDESYRVLKPNGLLFLSTPNVHSVMQKIRYLFSDRLGWFFERDYLGSGHIHPIFHWLLLRMIRDKFRIECYDSNSFHLRLIPHLPAIKVPFKHRLFAVNNIYVLKVTLVQNNFLKK